MAYKDHEDFLNDYPGGYSKNGTVYDGNDQPVGYQTGDGDYRITDHTSNNGQLYHNHWCTNHVSIKDTHFKSGDLVFLDLLHILFIGEEMDTSINKNKQIVLML